MTWYFWLTVAVLVLSVVGSVADLYITDGDYVPIYGLIILVAFCATGWMLANHFIPSADSSSPSPPGRACVVKQLQDVPVGKVIEEQWVCIGWAQ